MIENRLIKTTLLVCLIFIFFLHWYLTRMTPNLYYGKVFYKLGMECQDKCSLDKQLSYFRKAVFYDQNLKDAYYQMGIIYGKQGQVEKEIVFYKKLAALDHANADVYSKVGRYYFEKGEWDYALRYFLQADRYKSIDEVVYWIAGMYENKGKYKEAIFQYARLITRDSVFVAQACERIKRISKLPDQQGVVLDQIYQLLHWPRSELWKQMEQYLLTDQIPEFIHKSREHD